MGSPLSGTLYSSTLWALPERTIDSIAPVDERLNAPERRRKPKISIPLDGRDLRGIIAAPGGKHAVVACNEGLIVVNNAARTSRLLSAGPSGYYRPFYMTVRDTGDRDHEELVITYEQPLRLDILGNKAVSTCANWYILTRYQNFKIPWLHSLLLVCDPSVMRWLQQ